jgi:hypothetical protein
MTRRKTRTAAAAVVGRLFLSEDFIGCFLLEGLSWRRVGKPIKSEERNKFCKRCIYIYRMRIRAIRE